MNSPKEKAKELVEKFRKASRHKYIERTGEDADRAGKELAIICVDEILSAKHDCGCEQSIVIEGKYETYVTYYNKVKEEIQLL